MYEPEIGDSVLRTEQVYWSSSHPDESGYTPTEYSGIIINTKDDKVVMWSNRHNRIQVYSLINLQFLNLRKLNAN
jgi:hypothetical protein